MDFLNAVKRYQLSRLLEISSSFSMRLFNSKEPIARISRYNQSRFITGSYRLAGSTPLLPWFLVDISYYAVKCSNDFKARIPDERDFLNIYNEFIGFDGQRDSSQYSTLREADKRFYILFGLTQKTFWFQQLGRLRDMHSRFYELLYRMPKGDAGLPQFYRKVESKYGVDFDTYNMSSLALLWIASTNPYFRFPYAIGERLKARNLDNDLLKTMLLDYVADYSVIRNSSLGPRQLYLTPVVTTSKNEMLSVSAFLVAKKAVVNLYWETRALYRDNEGIELNQLLGHSFERYVDELLAFYLSSQAYERLPESGRRKSADLVITTCKYKIITEQKFSMLNISFWDTLFDLEKMDKWLKAYMQAASQLRDTENQIGQENRTIIKLILFFDDLFFGDSLVKDRVMRLCKEDHVEPFDLDNIFMVSIGEYEMLIQTLSSNEDLFNKIMETKIDRENIRDDSKGFEFYQIMQEYGITENNYVKAKDPFGKLGAR